MAEMYGKVEGRSRGRGGSMHLFDASRRFYGGNAIVGGGLPVAVGLALADHMQRPRPGHRLLLRRGRRGRGRVPRDDEPGRPVAPAGAVLLREQPLRDGHGAGPLRVRDRPGPARPPRYEMPAWAVDGMDVLAVDDAARQACVEIRGGGGPVFLELRTYRFRAHSMYDPERYRDKDEVEAWRSATRSRCSPPRSSDAGPARRTATLERDRGRGRGRDRRRGRLRRGRHARAGRGPHPLRLQRGADREDHLPRGDARGAPRGADRATSGCSSWARTSAATAAASR